MEKTLVALAPAKVNLFLDVGGKREDGYHEIFSIMQSIGIYDSIAVTRSEYNGESEIDVDCSAAGISGEDNLVYKAAKAFFEYTGIEKYNVKFEIEKKIPMQAGLGGGSSDAASALHALNALFETGLSTEQLCDIGLKVGSDVPFCIVRGTAVVGGRGENISDCAPMPDCYAVVAMPNGSKMSTAEAYRLIDAVSETGCLKDMADGLKECDISKIAGAMFNKFELIMDSGSPSMEIKRDLKKLGALAALMSGSGTAVFGLFDSVSKAKTAAESLRGKAKTFVASLVRRSESVFRDAAK